MSNKDKIIFIKYKCFSKNINKINCILINLYNNVLVNYLIIRGNMSNTYYNTFRLLTTTIAVSACLSASQQLELSDCEHKLPNVDYSVACGSSAFVSLQEGLVDCNYKFARSVRSCDSFYADTDISHLGIVLPICTTEYLFTPVKKAAGEEINLIYYGTSCYEFKWGHCKIRLTKSVEESDSDSDSNDERSTTSSTSHSDCKEESDTSSSSSSDSDYSDFEEGLSNNPSSPCHKTCEESNSHNEGGWNPWKLFCDFKTYVRSWWQ